MKVLVMVAVTVVGLLTLITAGAQTVDLAAGAEIARTIVGFEPDRFRVLARAGELVTVEVQQDGADVVVSVVDPAGRQVDEFDSPNGVKGPEPVQFVAPVDGRYEVLVRALEPDAPPGRYTLLLRSTRKAQEEDRRTLERARSTSRANSPLQRTLAALAGGTNARWGVYVKCLETGEEASIDAERRLETMSVIKLPILAALLEQVSAGRRSLDERVTVTAGDVQGGTGIIRMLDIGAQLTLRDLATLMINVSDNTATEMILSRVGGPEPVNRLMERYGLDTRLEVGTIKEWFDAYTSAANPAAFHNDDKVHLGLSSARDMGKLLEMMVRGQVVNQAASSQMMQMMRQQLYASRLPRDLPFAYRMPHKTGDYAPYLQNDVGIIESGGRHIVVVVFASHHTGDGVLLDQTIGRLGQFISDYFARP